MDLPRSVQDILRRTPPRVIEVINYHAFVRATGDLEESFADNDDIQCCLPDLLERMVHTYLRRSQLWQRTPPEWSFHIPDCEGCAYFSIADRTFREQQILVDFDRRHGRFRPVSGVEVNELAEVQLRMAVNPRFVRQVQKIEQRYADRGLSSFAYNGS